MTDAAVAEPKADLGFDPAALREKYRAERDKRLRADGNEQYREIKGEFAHYLDDPYVEPGFTRAPLTDEVEVVVIGGGFGGLLAGARLREAGVEDIRIIEKGGDFGGTWYWNRYPGAACDIESYIYLPLLEEIGYMPVEKYSRAPEILKHSRAIGEHFDLYRNACFQTEITGLRWDEAAKRWIVQHQPRRRDARALRRHGQRPAAPAEAARHPGRRDVQGPQLPHQPLGLWLHRRRLQRRPEQAEGQGGRDHRHRRDRRAVRAAPAPRAPSTSTSSSARPRPSTCAPTGRPIRTGPRRSQPGWQQHRMDNFNALVSGGFAEEDLVNDGWTDIIGNLLLLMRKGQGSGQSMEALAETMQLADFQKMEQVRARVDQVVRDPATADALKPWYNQFCKRPCFHDEYLDAFNRPNVTLVDTEGQRRRARSPRRRSSPTARPTRSTA